MSELLTQETRTRIETLRNDHKKAIKLCEYEYAKELEKQIRDVKRLAIEEYIAQVLEALELNLHACCDNYEESVDTIKREHAEQERVIRKRYHLSFTDLKNTQVSKLVKLEKELDDSRLREHLREIPEMNDLLEQSRKAAESGLYDDAVDLRDQARAGMREIREKNLQRVEDDFIQKRRDYLERFKEEVKTMSEQLDSDLKNNRIKTKKKIAVKGENRDNHIRDLMHKATAKVAKAKTGKAEKGEETPATTVQNEAARILAERGFALPGEPKLSE